MFPPTRIVYVTRRFETDAGILAHTSFAQGGLIMHSFQSRIHEMGLTVRARGFAIPSVFAVLAVLLGFGSARAQVTHVDPAAPCYRWPAVDVDEDGVFDRVDHCPGTKKGCTVDRYGCSSDGDGDGVCDGLDRCPDTPAGTTVDSHGCPGRAAAAPPPPVTPPPPPPPAVIPPKKVSEAERQLVEKGRIRLENIYFETGSARLLPESESSLREVGEALEKFPQLKIEIQGHTDTRGSAGYNQRLSQARAESVRGFMIEHFRVSADHLIAKGYGESEPETQERNDEELFRNRRVELKVLNRDALPRTVDLEEGKR